MKKTLVCAAALPLVLSVLSGHSGGMDWGVALDGYPITPSRLAETREKTGTKPDMVVFFLAWPEIGDSQAKFPAASLKAIRAAGAAACLTWEPMYFKNGKEHAVRAEAVLGGEYDIFLRSFARAAADWGEPFIIRFAHEMNLSRYHWGVSAEDYGPESPGLYAQMFRYVAALFRNEGADNVLWAFCPNAESVPRDDWNKIAAYYPGDEFVDLLGIDGYNWGDSRTLKRHGWQSRWQTFEEIFGGAKRELREINTEKPIIIFETASVEKNGRQKEWLEDAVKTAREWGLSGIAWFQADKENDWRLRPDSVRALKKLLSERQKPRERINHEKR